MSETPEEISEEVELMKQEPMYRNQSQRERALETGPHPAETALDTAPDYEGERYQYAEDESFVKRLEEWLREQPEYLAALSHGREERRMLARLVAQTLFRFPDAPARPSVRREDRRKLERNFRKQEIAPKLGAWKAKRNSLVAKAEKDRQRYGRLSEARTHELALQLNRAHDARVAQGLLDDVAAQEAYEASQEEGNSV